MAKPQPNVALRVLVLFAVSALGILVFIAVLNTQSRKNQPPAVPAPTDAPFDSALEDEAVDALAEAAQAQRADGQATDSAPSGTPADPASNVTGTRTGPAVTAPTPATQDAAPATATPSPTTTRPQSTPSYSLRVITEAERTPFTPIGSFLPDGTIDTTSPHALGLWFNRTGAGIDQIALTNHFTTFRNERHERVQVAFADRARDEVGLLPPGARTLPPFTLHRVFIDGVPVSLTQEARLGDAWRQVEPGVFVAAVHEGGRPIVEIERRFVIEQGRYDFAIRQSVRNLTDRPLKVALEFDGPIELPRISAGYGGDKRRLRFGFIGPVSTDPAQNFVRADKFMLPRDDLFKLKNEQVWPRLNNGTDNTLVWTAMTNRYFGVVMHPLEDTPRPGGIGVPTKAFSLVERLSIPDAVRAGGRNSALPPILRVRTAELEAPPNERADFSIGIYAGPLDRRTINAEPLLANLGIERVVVYTFGGPCAFCTFQWLTGLLKSFLSLLHDYLVFDWALAIILLVVCVRTVLHPVTKFSQVRMHKFSKQLQALAPKQQKLQERYKDDPAKLRQEMAKLFQEENVQFSGALGCLPMFLQTPVWIALYAMLYFVFDLRHEPAFFGVIQSATGGWAFLADLAEPDHLIGLPERIWFSIPLMGEIRSINILPLLLGVVFYAHQKYLTPPPSATMSPEQKQTQVLMRVMIVVMFPIFMYNAPSGLAIYFITNSLLGIVESRYIRSHADKLIEEELKNPRVRRKPAGGGFMARMQQLAEQRQRLAAEQKGQASRRGDKPRQTGLGQTRGRGGKKSR